MVATRDTHLLYWRAQVGGDKLDEVIATYVKRRYNLLIGERTAEEVKVQIGSALPLTRDLEIEVSGRDQIDGLPKTITLKSSDASEAMA